jgi:hypothetical protein
VIISNPDLRSFQSSISTIVDELDSAGELAADPPDVPPAQLRLQYNGNGSPGRRGRPSVVLDETFLENGLRFRGVNQMAEVVGCSPRTIRRRAQAIGVLLPGRPVFQYERSNDGERIGVHQRESVRKPTNLTDAELDARIAEILQAFPTLGRAMIMGALKSRGYIVTRERVRRSIERVQGVPASFARRTIVRRQYSVKGPMSLWHHDGQHGKQHSPPPWLPTHCAFRSHLLPDRRPWIHRRVL